MEDLFSSHLPKLGTAFFKRKLRAVQYLADYLLYGAQGKLRHPNIFVCCLKHPLERNNKQCVLLLCLGVCS